jgi:valyl-tRNA synthetase
MDTWATSSLSPQIVGRWMDTLRNSGDPALFAKVFPFSLRPQAHEIIRTWAFYTIVKAHHHLGELPWTDVLISGWGLAGEGMGKISKSRGGGPMPPLEMIERYSADAVRYWAASTGPGKDSIISEEKIQMGSKLVTKLWNVARFSERFLEGDLPSFLPAGTDRFTPADRWILSRLQRLVRRATQAFENYDYATAKSEVEAFFWTELADNYLEMCKQRLYDETHPQRDGARYSLYNLLLALIKLLAPLLPFVTETIYQEMFAAREGEGSIHRAPWPIPDSSLEDEEAEAIGEILLDIAAAVRRYKSERNLSLGTELKRLQLTFGEPEWGQALASAAPDLKSITRSRQVEIARQLDHGLERLKTGGVVEAAVEVLEDGQG